VLRRVKITRDTILFTAGLLGVLYQTVVEHIDRPVLLALLMGLPVFLGRDEKKAAPKEPATPELPENEKAEES
jgi:hypothetical protein